jgi:4a-hydroxytetrahydrobiopterin dehydratase
MLLSSERIASALAALPGWKLEGTALVRTYRLPSFPDAIAFLARLAFEAEAHDHHPAMLVDYRNVTVTWTTHSAGGVTERDVDGARHADRIRAAMAPDGA